MTSVIILIDRKSRNDHDFRFQQFILWQK